MGFSNWSQWGLSVSYRSQWGSLISSHWDRNIMHPENLLPIFYWGTRVREESEEAQHRWLE